MQDWWIGLAWLAVPWYPVAVHHAGWVDWAGLVSSALVSSDSPPCRMGSLGWPGGIQWQSTMQDGWIGLACLGDCIGVNMITS